MSYAFRLFAAIYNYEVVEASNSSRLIQCVYSEARPQEPDSRTFWIPARYQVRSDTAKHGRLVRHCYLSEDFYLVEGVDEVTGHPDWLGEIFTWVSSALEKGIGGRDSVGRIPYSEMVFNRQGISAWKPYAAMIMAWMESALRNEGEVKKLCRAPSPAKGTEHFVVSSHDIDFYYTDRRAALVRLLKNLGISFRDYRSWSFFRSNSRMLAQVICGKSVGDYLPSLIEAGRKSEFQSTVFAVSKRIHRRDPDYNARKLGLLLSEASRNNFPVGLHGSYTSVIEAEDLVSEVSALVGATGMRPMGTRQHWLRFDRHEKLFEAIEKARLIFDSSLGFHDKVGFRNGANFAFPPYDFKNEKPHEFLEIPLVIMDGGLEAAARSHGINALKIAEDVLAESRKWGWGGISVLWHNPIEAIQVPHETNEVFWECLKRKKLFQEKWTSAEEFISCSLRRYQNAGLLRNVKIETNAPGKANVAVVGAGRDM
jgi:hypothetical protein